MLLDTPMGVRLSQLQWFSVNCDCLDDMNITISWIKIWNSLLLMNAESRIKSSSHFLHWWSMPPSLKWAHTRHSFVEKLPQKTIRLHSAFLWWTRTDLHLQNLVPNNGISVEEQKQGFFGDVLVVHNLPPEWSLRNILKTQKKASCELWGNMLMTFLALVAETSFCAHAR